MGVGRLICNLFLGPFLIYAILVAHLFYHSFVKEPAVKGGNVEIPSWPSTVSTKEKGDLIAQRKLIMKDYMDFAFGKIKGNAARQVAEKLFTKNVQFDDFIQRFNNAKDMADGIIGQLRMLSSVEVKVIEEHHGPHEIVLALKTTISPFEGWKLPEFYLLCHILLESPSKKGEQEKIFKIYEECQGNPQLNERTFAPSIIGKIHSKLRVFHGQLMLLIIRTFGLA